MGGGIKEGGDEDLITEINVTPLVDIVLVLLIILMVTATAIVSKTIPMELPEAATGESTSTTLAVSIDADGDLFIDARPVNTEQFRQQVRQARSENDEVRAVIAADGGIAHRRVVQVIDLLRQEDVTKFAINVRPSEVQQQ